MTLKVAVTHATPRASVRTATPVKAGERRSERSASKGTSLWREVRLEEASCPT
jgi:hypothetical protein